MLVLIKYSSKVRFVIITFLLMLGFNYQTYAAFDVLESDPYDESYYGNATNRTFKEAVEGTEPTLQDEKFMQQVDQERVYERWYLRALMGRPKVKLRDIRNTSFGTFNGLQGGVRETENHLFQLLLAWGYKWTTWAMETELLFSETIKYHSNPLVPTAIVEGNADIKQFAILFNLEYNFPRWFSFQPKDLHAYVMAGLGPVFKTTDTQALSIVTIPPAIGPNVTPTFVGQPKESSSARTTDAAYQCGIGFRYQITTKFLIDVVGRYVELGDTVFGPVEGITLKSDTSRASGIFFGATYQL